MSSIRKKSNLPAPVIKHYYLHAKATKIASNNFTLVTIAAVFLLGFDILLAFTKDRFVRYAAGKSDFEDWNRFFGLKEWAQWTILGAFTFWALLEIGMAKLLQYSIQNESRPHLQVWLILYVVDVFIAFAVLITIICFVVLSTKIMLGIIGIVFTLTELYYFSILYRYCISLKTTARYEVCQTEDDKEFTIPPEALG